MWGTTIGVIQGDTRSLDYSSNDGFYAGLAIVAIVYLGSSGAQPQVVSTRSRIQPIF